MSTKASEATSTTDHEQKDLPVAGAAAREGPQSQAYDAAAPDHLASIIQKEVEQDHLLKEIVGKKDSPLFDIEQTAMDLKDSEELIQLMDDIQLETCEEYFYDDILQFIQRAELSTEEIILKRICPSKFHERRSATSSNSLRDQDGKYVSLWKSTFLNDIKVFLYDYCTTGEFYHKQTINSSGFSGEEEDEPITLQPQPIKKLLVLKIIHCFK